jgi:hypothetical protein
MTTPHASRWFRIAALAALAIALFLLDVAIGVAPNIDSESSWAEVLAWGAINHTQWGTDIAFTYGPFGFLTPWYHHVPGAFVPFIVGQVLLAAVFCVCVIALLRRTSAALLMLFAIAYVCAFHRIPGDTAWVLTLVFGTTALTAVGRDQPSAVRWALLLIFALASACIAQIKLSVFPIWLVCVAVLALQARARRLEAAAIALTFLGTFLVLWLGARQELGNLPTFLRATMEIATGYGHAMGLRADPFTESLGAVCTLWFGLACMFLFWRFRRDATVAATIVLYAVVGALLWRANFTRADHAPWFFGCYALLPFGLLCHPRLADLQSARRSLVGLVVVCAVASLYGHDVAAWLHPRPEAVLNPATRLVQNAGALTSALDQRWQSLLHPSDRAAMLELAWANAAKNNDLPVIRARIGNNKVDVYTNDQGIALLNGFNYAPRPVFQSYSAYTPDLARMNESHALGPTAPPFVLLRLDSIDNRVTMGEDGLALIALLTHYRPVLKESGFLLLQRDEAVGTAAATTPQQAGRTTQIGVDVPMGASESPMVAFIHVELGWLGKFYSALIREPVLTITFRTGDGTTIAHRLVRPTAASGFLISPVIDSVDEWTRLYLSMPLPQVRSFRIDAEIPWERLFFQQEFAVELRPLSILHGDVKTLSADGGSLMIYPGFNLMPVFVHGYARTYAEAGQDVAGFQVPASVAFEPTPGIYDVSATYGVQGGALVPDCVKANADGVGISVIRHHGDDKSVLWHGELDPFHAQHDNGPHRFQVSDVRVEQGDAIEVFIDPGHGGNNMACDWAYLRDLSFAAKNPPADGNGK